MDARGREVTDEAELERIRALAIPPAWEDVWISPSPGAKLQATGVDAAGRTQYLYHPRFRAMRERAKFDRLLHFARSLPDLRASTTRHLRLEAHDPDWTCAIAVGVVNKAWLRVGDDRHARRARTYGVTTLRKRHVSIDGDEITFCFRAKNRRLVRRTLRHPTLAAGVRSLTELPGGSRLFRFLRDGETADLTARQLNAYIAEHMGNGFTAKDFRTWGGTLLAAVELDRLGSAGSEEEAKRAVAATMRKVGDELGNTPAVARASYVSPVVVESYLDGVTIATYRRRRRSSRHLTADESALLGLLRARA